MSRFSHSRGFAARPFRYSPRPFYRPFFYRPYRHYSPYFFGAFSFGWPYYGRFGWPYESHVYIYDDGPSYYGGPGYDYGGPGYEVPPDDGRYEADRGSPPDPAARGSRETGRVRLEVRPEDAAIYVDDELWGDASETKFLTLRSGRHVIELVRPGYEAARREVEVERGETSDLLVELRRR